MDKASTSGSNSGKKSIIPKPITPVGYRPGAALGTKIPAHMTPDEKAQLLKKLEEWRKSKHQAKQDIAGKSKIPSVVPTIVKPKIPAANMTKPIDANLANDGNNGNNVKKEENVFERLFRNATRVSSAKVVEKVEPKPEPLKNSRLSIRPKKPNSSSSLNRQSNLSNSASKKAAEAEMKKVEQHSAPAEIPKEEPKVIVQEPVSVEIIAKEELKVIDQQPAPVDIPKEIEHHPESVKVAEENEIVSAPMEVLEEPVTILEGPIEILGAEAIFIQPEQVPEPEAFEEIISEPIEVIVMEEEEQEVKPVYGDISEPIEVIVMKEEEEEVKPVNANISTESSDMECDKVFDESEEKTPIVQNPPSIIISEPEEKKNVLKTSSSDEKPRPSVKFLSDEKPKKKIAFPKIKPLDNNTKKPIEKLKSQKPVKTLPAKEEKKPKTKIRRSISMIHRKKSGNVNSAIHRTISEQDLSFTEPEIEVPKLKEDIEERISRRRSKSVSFLTPKDKTPTPVNLRDKLETWLKDRGHSISGYRHLKCFGVHTQNNPNSSIFQTPNRSFNDLEVSQYATAPNSPNMSFLEDSDKENVTPATAIQKVDIKEVEGWLSDLHKLIVELKYPHNRCEEWLSAIRRKCIGCTQLPVYWECLAALEQSRGDMNTAIEYYERAIIKGAEVEEIGESLEQLFDKLVIDSNKPTPSKPDKSVDPKNIFKSTIIKFALQQKAVKELGPEIGTKARQQLYIATPVRRSTRLQTPYKPHVVSSLQSIDPEIKSSVTFQPNKFLVIEK